MTNIAYVVGGLLALMLAGHLNESGAAPAATLPLALLGLSTILKGLTHARDKATSQSAGEPQARVEHAVEEVPFAEEIADASAAPGVTKIPAQFGKPAPAAAPTPFRNPHASGGHVALSSAKNLNGGKPDFRKGSVRETHD